MLYLPYCYKHIHNISFKCIRGLIQTNETNITYVNYIIKFQIFIFIFYTYKNISTQNSSLYFFVKYKNLRVRFEIVQCEMIDNFDECRLFLTLLINTSK